MLFRTVINVIPRSILEHECMTRATLAERRSVNVSFVLFGQDLTFSEFASHFHASLH